jgi:hypothetical protein
MALFATSDVSRGSTVARAGERCGEVRGGTARDDPRARPGPRHHPLRTHTTSPGNRRGQTDREEGVREEPGGQPAGLGRNFAGEMLPDTAETWARDPPRIGRSDGAILVENMRARDIPAGRSGGCGWDRTAGARRDRDLARPGSRPMRPDQSVLIAGGSPSRPMRVPTRGGVPGTAVVTTPGAPACELGPGDRTEGAAHRRTRRPSALRRSLIAGRCPGTAVVTTPGALACELGPGDRTDARGAERCPRPRRWTSHPRGTGEIRGTAATSPARTAGSPVRDGCDPDTAVMPPRAARPARSTSPGRDTGVALRRRGAVPPMVRSHGTQ